MVHQLISMVKGSGLALFVFDRFWKSEFMAVILVLIEISNKMTKDDVSNENTTITIRNKRIRTYEACLGYLGIQDICHFTFRDMVYLLFYLMGYGIFVA